MNTRNIDENTLVDGIFKFAASEHGRRDLVAFTDLFGATPKRMFTELESATATNFIMSAAMMIQLFNNMPYKKQKNNKWAVDIALEHVVSAALDHITEGE